MKKTYILLCLLSILFLSGAWSMAAVPESSVNLKLDYEYSKDGRVTARTFNNRRDEYIYDLRDQLIEVIRNGRSIEKYVYDPAGWHGHLGIGSRARWRVSKILL